MSAKKWNRMLAQRGGSRKPTSIILSSSTSCRRPANSWNDWAEERERRPVGYGGVQLLHGTDTDTSRAASVTVQGMKNSSIIIHRDVLLEERRSCSDEAPANLAFHSQQIWSEQILRKAHWDHFTYVDLIVCQGVTDDVELERAQCLRELLNSNRVAWNKTTSVVEQLIHSFINSWEHLSAAKLCCLVKGKRNIRTSVEEQHTGNHYCVGCK